MKSSSEPFVSRWPQSTKRFRCTCSLPSQPDNKLAVAVLKDIADEERVHAGEFLRLLRELAPDEEKFYAKGAKEVEAKIEKKLIAFVSYGLHIMLE